MIGEAPRFPSRRGDHIDVIVPIVIARVGDHRSIGREDRAARGPGAGHQALGVTTLAIDDPDVAAEGESDLGLAERGALQQERSGIGRKSRDRGKKCEKAGQQYATHRLSELRTGRF